MIRPSRHLWLHPAVKQRISFCSPRTRAVQCDRFGMTFLTLAAPNKQTPSCPTNNAASPPDLSKIQCRTQQLTSHLQPLTYNNQTRNFSTMSAIGHSKAGSQYTARRVGAPNTLEHRIFIEKDGVPVSPFHDIPLYANEQQTVLNMIVEVPRWTNAKMEVRLVPLPQTLLLCSVW